MPLCRSCVCFRTNLVGVMGFGCASFKVSEPGVGEGLG